MSKYPIEITLHEDGVVTEGHTTIVDDCSENYYREDFVKWLFKQTIYSEGTVFEDMFSEYRATKEDDS